MVRCRIFNIRKALIRSNKQRRATFPIKIFTWDHKLNPNTIFMRKYEMRYVKSNTSRIRFASESNRNANFEFPASLVGICNAFPGKQADTLSAWNCARWTIIFLYSPLICAIKILRPFFNIGAFSRRLSLLASATREIATANTADWIDKFAKFKTREWIFKETRIEIPRHND